jgi:hypothetical protein
VSSIGKMPTTGALAEAPAALAGRATAKIIAIATATNTNSRILISTTPLWVTP